MNATKTLVVGATNGDRGRVFHCRGQDLVAANGHHARGRDRGRLWRCPFCPAAAAGALCGGDFDIQFSDHGGLLLTGGSIRLSTRSKFTSFRGSRDP